jgi:ABC-type nitrate/sulfonate/bicarbonate transport system substrate-binding protein
VLTATAKALIAALALLLSLLTPIVQRAQNFPTIEISIVGAPNAICILSQALYIFGYENSTGYPRINAVVVDAVSKAITKAFTGSFGGFYSSAAHGGRIYVVGVANRSRSSTS